MAADVTRVVETVPKTATPEPPRTTTPHRTRFLVIYGVLGAVIVAAIAGIVIFAGRSINPAPAWSAWKPKGGGLGAAQEIAAHVSAAYRLPNGDQLVDVIPKEPSVTSPQTGTVPIHYVAIRGRGGAADQIFPISSTDSVMYTLCGLGAACSIVGGKATPQRGQVIEREILELALFTFKYVPSIDNVMAFIPPKPGTATKYVVLLRRGDVADALKQPFTKTLSAKAPPSTGLPAQEVRVVAGATGRRVYTFGFTQAPQGDLVFALDPFVA